MNRIDQLFKNRTKGILSVYFTAGYPYTGSTREIIENLVKSGVDMIEIGIPFSDPLADGPVIQGSSSTAIKNGMSLELLFRQLEGVRVGTGIPLLLMGYLNPVLKFGMEKFCRYCSETGIDGVILPDLPPEIYKAHYQEIFRKYGLCNILLVSPDTRPDRLRFIDSLSEGFIYVVSSSSVTGTRGSFTDEQRKYFQRIKESGIQHPTLIGFGVSGKETFSEACRLADGAIVGSAFIKLLASSGTGFKFIKEFVEGFRLEN